MDILGSALTNPTVSWTFVEPPKIKGRQVVVSDGQDEFDGPSSRKQQNNGKSSSSIKTRLKKLIIRRFGGDSSEREPLISRPPRPPAREKLKSAGKRFRKALHRSIMYMAAGMENMSSTVWISSTVPNPAYYHDRNNFRMPNY